MSTHILLLDRPDQTGLVCQITGVLFRHGYNIITNNEFVDRNTAHLFIHTEFAGQREPEQILGELRAPPAARVRLAHTPRRRIGDRAQTGRDVEKIVLAWALKLVFEERIFLSDNRTIIFE